MKKLEDRLRAAFPQLTDADFGHHATDLYVVAYPFVGEWLRKNYEFWSNVTTFTGQPGSGWNGAGRLCYDIPFAGNWKAVGVGGTVTVTVEKGRPVK